MDIHEYVMRVVGIILIGGFVLPKLAREWRGSENGLKADRWVMVGLLNIVMLWQGLGILLAMGIVPLGWALTVSSYSSFAVSLAFWLIAFRPQIRDFLHRVTE